MSAGKFLKSWGCAALLGISGSCGAAGPAKPDDAVALRAAARDGPVAVLISLPAAAGDEEAIRAAQERLLSALAGSRVEAVKRFRFTPALALTVDAKGLEKLLSVAGAEAVRPDVAAPPAE